MVLVIRKDLKMRKGKMIAQANHAFKKVFFDRGSITRGIMHIPLEKAMEEWINGIFTTICVSVNSEAELLEIYDEAKIEGLPCSLIQDCGLTEFDGVPTYTAVAIGPDKNDAIDVVTKGLPLL